MKGRLLDLGCRDEWKSYHERLPAACSDIYASPDYYEVFEKRGDGKAHGYLYEEGEGFVLYPFLMNPVRPLGLLDPDEEYFDIQGAYGYNGPYASSVDDSLIGGFSREFVTFCHEAHIVAEFIRFNPVIGNHRFLTYLTPLDTLDNVVVDLTLSEEDLWMKSYDHGVRKAISKGERSGLACEIILSKNMSAGDIGKFVKLYHATMSRNQAGEFYFFDEDFFRQLAGGLPHNSLFVLVYKDQVPISTELVLFGRQAAYGFLGGTLAEYYSLSPNSYLRHHLILHLKQKGLKFYSIGGGIKRNDNIYKFKKSFSRNVDSTFYIGKKVHNLPLYDDLCRAWEQKNPGKKEIYGNYILKYRY
jgi:hypothetical protein